MKNQKNKTFLVLHYSILKSNGNPLQYSCLENPMDGGAWGDTVHGVTKSRTWLSDFTHSLTSKSTVVQYNSWHPGAGIQWTGRKSYWLEEGEEVGNDRAKGSSEIGDGGQAEILLIPDVDRTHIRILESSQLKGSYVGDLK